MRALGARTMPDTIRLKFRVGDFGPVLTVRGRYAWTLGHLIDAGERGVTPIERPAPRWSHYVFILRDEIGLAIQTVPETHGGNFSGRHGRYVLKSDVQVLERVTK